MNDFRWQNVLKLWPGEGLGSSWECSCRSGRRLWSHIPAKRAQDLEFESILRATWVQVGPKMAEVATKIVILSSFLELSWMIFRLLSPIFAEMGEVEKRRTVQRFWWIFRIWSIAWRLLDAILEEIWSNSRSHFRSCGYDLSFLATC